MPIKGHIFSHTTGVLGSNVILAAVYFTIFRYISYLLENISTILWGHFLSCLVTIFNYIYQLSHKLTYKAAVVS